MKAGAIVLRIRTDREVLELIAYRAVLRSIAEGRRAVVARHFGVHDKAGEAIVELHRLRRLA